MPTHYVGDEITRRALDTYIKLSRARKTVATLSSRMIEEMGVDRHMEEILRVQDQGRMTDR